ncbi:tetratricopeptide repeat protein [Spirulina subsalsa FACHB-351]|uniref:Tetratricopeptide repeat protein n=1 Tax=Spirulina subsalsa FACHB-351 TaxID=234711 RepID=A0ABT3KZN4_9CYAN|nr:tetratricopeptide repeat protein [Spirulina subsalsa]MCW6034713.1 tetratricopeptide repeat protein [Spirulina subsalsa FACHB-351]
MRLFYGLALVLGLTGWGGAVLAQSWPTGLHCESVEMPSEVEEPMDGVRVGDFRFCGGDVAGAIAAYEGVLGQLLPEQEMERVYVQLRLARALVVVGELEGAWGMYREAIAQDPLYGRILDDRQYSPLGEPVTDGGVEGEANKAPVFVDGPVSAIAYFELGWALEQGERWTEAVEAYQKAIEINPQLAFAHSRLGYTLFRLEDYDQAQVALERALDLNPELVWAYYDLGYLFTWIHQANLAFPLFRQVIEFHTALQPFGEDDKDAIVYQMIGDVFMEQGTFAPAAQAYEQAIFLAPQQSWVYFRLGVALVNVGQESKAREAFREAVSRLPNDAIPYNNTMALDLAQALILEQQWARAKAVIEEVLNRSPHSIRGQQLLEQVERQR